MTIAIKISGAYEMPSFKGVIQCTSNKLPIIMQVFLKIHVTKYFVYRNNKSLEITKKMLEFIYMSIQPEEFKCTVDLKILHLLLISDTIFLII